VGNMCMHAPGPGFGGALKASNRNFKPALLLDQEKLR
jgi:hypothetical protein